MVPYFETVPYFEMVPYSESVLFGMSERSLDGSLKLICSPCHLFSYFVQMNIYWTISILWTAVHAIFSLVSCLPTASSFWDNFFKSLFDNNNKGLLFWMILDIWHPWLHEYDIKHLASSVEWYFELTLSLPAYHCRQWNSWRIYASPVAKGLKQQSFVLLVDFSLSSECGHTWTCYVAILHAWPLCLISYNVFHVCHC